MNTIDHNNNHGGGRSRSVSHATHSHSTNMDQFDTLKREATKLERNLEDKVARYQQVRIVYDTYR